jgi:hypothetical protein
VKGARIRYSAEELAFIERHSAMPRVELHAAFLRTFVRPSVSVDNIKSLCTRMGWNTGRRPWSDQDDALLRELYPNHPAAAIAKQLGRTLAATYGRAKGLGLEKTAEFYASPASGCLRPGDKRGAGSRFRKGNVPANKGTRRPGWAPGRMASTQFKAGQDTWNDRPIGSERVSMGYRFTKVSNRVGVPWTKNWKQTHILRWEAESSQIPRQSPQR